MKAEAAEGEEEGGEEGEGGEGGEEGEEEEEGGLLAKALKAGVLGECDDTVAWDVL